MTSPWPFARALRAEEALSRGYAEPQFPQGRILTCGLFFSSPGRTPNRALRVRPVASGVRTSAAPEAREDAGAAECSGSG